MVGLICFSSQPWRAENRAAADDDPDAIDIVEEINEVLNDPRLAQPIQSIRQKNPIPVQRVQILQKRVQGDTARSSGRLQTGGC